MNNLLRTLTESQVRTSHPDSDLKLLLTTVKEGRRQSYDAKLSDPFYDSLEGLLIDLKTITIDNHDPEAFLKPVSKVEVPDYYDVIANPMDFQTMLKKVKQKQYKSKREFNNDLELIWSNCYTYNATENHPLRQCVKRLKVKADRLLRHITDRKERTDPSLPSDLAVGDLSRPKLNGSGPINGRLYPHHRSPSSPIVSKATTPTIKPSTPLPAKHAPRRDVPFPDSLAIIRTPENMTIFSQLDLEITQALDPSMTSSRSHTDTEHLVGRLQDLAPPIERTTELDTESRRTPDDSSMDVDAAVGDKRKLNGGPTSRRPIKRARFSSQYATPVAFEKDELSELWWGAVQSDSLLANGLPGIAFPSSSAPQHSHTRGPKPNRRKKGPNDQSKSLSSIMNNNIKTMKRVRHTHAKFAALNLNNSNNDDPEGMGAAEGPGISGIGLSMGIQDDEGADVVDDKVDEREWISKIKGKRRVGGVDIGESNATNCVRWMSGKVLEHTGFQGTSQVALDVLAGVTSEYLLNVGRTIRFLCDKYSTTMTPEEIILHTLFESGTSKIQDLERYISDDIERYGARLADLEKKLVGAYRESTAVEVLEDEGLFDDEDEEDAGALAIGDFADALGEDYLGLRELGIAAEFGMSSLSIPKRLLKGKKGQNKLLSTAAKLTEPLPPYPPPPPFIPLSSAKVEDQIGLLQPYYQSRFASLAASSGPPHMPGPYNPTAGPKPHSNATDEVMPLPVVMLPDDLPNPAQAKMGPLGQIIKGGPTGGGSKKKKATVGIGIEGGVPPKKKGATGVGTGNGRKKKLADALAQIQGAVIASA